MSLNSIVLNGSIPHFDPNTYNQGDGDQNKSFLSWAISVQRNFKKQDEQYYPSDLINFKAFGPKADFIMNYFKQGDGIILTGRLQRDDDYIDQNTGETKKGQLFVLVETANFPVGKSNGEDSEGTTTANNSPKNTQSAPPKRPPLGGKAPLPPRKPVGKRPF